MLHKAWNSKEERPYCFPRSSIKFQGHTGQNINDFDPNWAFPDYRPVAAFKSLRFALLSLGLKYSIIMYFRVSAYRRRRHYVFGLSVHPSEAWNTLFWPVYGSVGPPNQPWLFYGMSIRKICKPSMNGKSSFWSWSKRQESPWRRKSNADQWRKCWKTPAVWKNWRDLKNSLCLFPSTRQLTTLVSYVKNTF